MPTEPAEGRTYPIGTLNKDNLPTREPVCTALRTWPRRQATGWDQRPPWAGWAPLSCKPATTAHAYPAGALGRGWRTGSTETRQWPCLCTSRHAFHTVPLQQGVSHVRRTGPPVSASLSGSRPSSGPVGKCFAIKQTRGQGVGLVAPVSLTNDRASPDCLLTPSWKMAWLGGAPCWTVGAWPRTTAL